MRKPILTVAAVALAVTHYLPASAQTRAKAPPRRSAPAPVQAASTPAQRVLEVPAAAVQLVLIRSTLAALDQANETANYSVLWGLGSDAFRARNSELALGRAFEAFRRAQIDLHPALVLNPRLARPPVIEQGRYLRLAGVVPTAPAQINFDLMFEPSQGHWKLANLTVQLSQSPGGAARQPPAQQAPQAPPQQSRSNGQR